MHVYFYFLLIYSEVMLISIYCGSVVECLWDHGEYSQMVRADRRNHALHAVQGDLQYHAVQKYLGVRKNQRYPAETHTQRSVSQAHNTKQNHRGTFEP